MNEATGTEAGTRQQLIAQILQLDGERLADVARFVGYVTNNAAQHTTRRVGGGAPGRRRTAPEAAGSTEKS